MKYSNTGMKHINTRVPVKLATLIVIGDIQDNSIVQIFDNTGSFLIKGRWYEDSVLSYADAVGIASKAGTGLTVSFKLSQPNKMPCRNYPGDSTEIVVGSHQHSSPRCKGREERQMNYNDEVIKRRMERICDRHFLHHCEGCPLLTVCGENRKPDETQGEFTRRWEAGMVAALEDIDR